MLYLPAYMEEETRIKMISPRHPPIVGWLPPKGGSILRTEFTPFRLVLSEAKEGQEC